MNLKKYWAIFQIAWQNGLTYRVDVLLWRLRQMLGTVMTITVWSVVYQNPTQLSYSAADMLTYLFTISALQSLIHSTSLHGLAWSVYSGELSYLLLRPVSWVGHLIVDDFADKLKNVLFVLIELGILAWWFKPELHFPSLEVGILAVISGVLGAVLLIEMLFLFGSLGFRSPDTWAPRFLFYILLDFAAGRLFPLDILPEFWRKIIFATPLPYFSFTQTQIWLGRINFSDGVKQTATMLIWVIIFWFINTYVWKKSFKEYSASGH